MTGAQLATLYQRRVRALDREIKKALNGIGDSAFRLSREKMVDGIYALPVDQTKAGKPKWKRTRRLYRGEGYEIRGKDTVAVVNRTPYAVARDAMGRPGGRQPNNPARIVHWQEEMAEIMRPIAVDIFKDAIDDALRKP
jgi:hypothetical protein